MSYAYEQASKQQPPQPPQQHTAFIGDSKDSKLQCLLQHSAGAVQSGRAQKSVYFYFLAKGKIAKLQSLLFIPQLKLQTLQMLLLRQQQTPLPQSPVINSIFFYILPGHQPSQISGEIVIVRFILELPFSTTLKHGFEFPSDSFANLFDTSFLVLADALEFFREILFDSVEFFVELQCIFLSLLLAHAGVLQIQTLITFKHSLFLMKSLKEFGPRQFSPAEVHQQQNDRLDIVSP